MTGRPSRRGPRRQLIRENDGTLYDLTNDRPMATSELRDYLNSGGYFVAKRADGAECTAQVLRDALHDVIGEAAPNPIGAMMGAGAAIPSVAWSALAGLLSGPMAGPRGHAGQRPRADRRPPSARAWQAPRNLDDRLSDAAPNSDPGSAPDPA